ncbi:MAG: Type 1 glutamine amidotransferase-like domain-containing protein [Candidatus Daviesbacteria bacterium]|nr:Type 1 glutamine amidotransferase-like domain-containing protein [Candidatus Daviesbacteria bacterium]
MSQIVVKVRNITPRLFLASIAANSLDKAINLFPDKPRNKTRVAFIPTAADPYLDKGFVEEDRSKLEKMGFDVFDLDIKDKRREELWEQLRSVDIIFVAGGNTFYLLNEVRKSDFDEEVKRLVHRERVLYIGSSAGSVLVGPDIKPVELLDDPSVATELQSTKGLNLIDFVVLPHYGDKKYEKEFKKIIAEYEDKYTLVKITNEQAVIVEGKSYSIV